VALGAAADAAPAATLRQAARHLLRLLLLARPYWLRLGGGVLFALAATGVSAGIPWITKLLIDEVYADRDVGLLHVLVGVLLALGVSSSLLGALRALFTAAVRARLVADVRLRFFNHLQHLPMRFFDDHRVGEVGSRLQEAGGGVETVGRTFETVVTQGLFLLVVPPALFLLDARLAALALVVVPLVALVTALASRRLRELWQANSQANGELAAFQVEVLSRIRTFKSFGLERKVYTEARRQVAAATAAQLRAFAAAHWLGGATGALRGLNTALLTWVGWSLILGGSMTLGDYVAFTAYLGFLYGPVFILFQVYSDLQQSAVHLGRMFEYWDLEAEQDPRPATAAAALPPAVGVGGAGGARLRRVSFAYRPGNRVLSDLDLDLPAGTVTAVVGASGSGKTTLLRLLAGLERCDAGWLELGGRRADRLTLAEHRALTSAVWQDGGLVRGSLWRNLTLAVDRRPSRHEVDRAVAICGLGAVVAGFADGYDGEVAEGGGTLSAGQQQRLALARAVLREAPLLLLDEATANLDVDTEMAVLGPLLADCRRRGRTVVFVTHRPATAALADRVASLDGGRVVAVEEASGRRAAATPPPACAVGEGR